MIALDDVDMWTLYEKHEWATFCITTNGFVKRNGEAVMGRGTARQATLRFPGLCTRLGRLLKQSGAGSFGLAGPPLGNHVHFVAPRLIAFPVKPVEVISSGRNVVYHVRERFPPGIVVPGWAAKADPDIIARSLKELAWMYENLGWANAPRDPESGKLLDPFDAKVFLPRPGCGAGELSWKRVKPLCEQYGDWLVIVHFSRSR